LVQRLGGGKRVACIVTMAACVPYLVLKVLWLGDLATVGMELAAAAFVVALASGRGRCACRQCRIPVRDAQDSAAAAWNAPRRSSWRDDHGGRWLHRFQQRWPPDASDRQSPEYARE